MKNADGCPQEQCIGVYSSAHSIANNGNGYYASDATTSYMIFGLLCCQFINLLCILLIHTRSVQLTGYTTCYNANII